MGMSSVYLSINDNDLFQVKKLCDMNLDIFEKLEEIEDNETEYSDIDKLWEAVIFLLTDLTTNEFDLSNIYTKAILGEYIISSEESYTISLGYTPHNDLTKIVSSLELLKRDFYYNKFDLELFNRNDVYPDIWDEDKDDLFEEIWTAIEGLIAFYKQVLVENKNIITYIV